MPRIHHRHRDRLLKARGNVCQLCGRASRVECHHIERQKHEGSSEDDNLILLCEACHTLTFNKGTVIDWDLVLEKAKKK